MEKIDISLNNCINIILNIFRIRCYNRTVIVVVGICKFVPLIRNAWVEDPRDPLIDQPLDVSVSQFGRVTFGFARNGFNAKLIDFPGGSR